MPNFTIPPSEVYVTGMDLDDLFECENNPNHFHLQADS